MAREKGWTNKQVFILVIVILIAVAVALIVPTVVKNYYQNNANFKGELATVARSAGVDCAVDDKECLKVECEKDCTSALNDCVNSCINGCPCSGFPCSGKPLSPDNGRCNKCVWCKEDCIEASSCYPIDNLCMLTCDFLYG